MRSGCVRRAPPRAYMARGLPRASSLASLSFSPHVFTLTCRPDTRPQARNVQFGALSLAMYTVLYVGDAGGASGGESCSATMDAMGALVGLLYAILGNID